MTVRLLLNLRFRRHSGAIVDLVPIPTACASRLLKGGGSGADAVGVGSARKAELPGEFAGVEKVGRIVLIEHFVGFRDQRIEPSCKPDHGPAQNAIFGATPNSFAARATNSFPVGGLGVVGTCQV